MSAPATTGLVRQLAPAEERGRLTIAPAVIRGIAEVAAGEVDGVVAGRRRSLGRSGRAARATTRLDGNAASVRVRVAVRYPTPINDVLDRLRAHIIDRVDQLTGMTVRVCDIDVAALRFEPLDSGGE
jgi:uncharacterized alkaline shock family protein YloU